MAKKIVNTILGLVFISIIIYSLYGIVNPTVAKKASVDQVYHSGDAVYYEGKKAFVIGHIADKTYCLAYVDETTGQIINVLVSSTQFSK